jgi:IS30 family transposase
MGSHYHHLTLEERRLIFRLTEAKLAVPLIATRLGRHRAMIYREIRRNWHDDVEAAQIGDYFPSVAHHTAIGRRRRLGKLYPDETLASDVVTKLQEAWSPDVAQDTQGDGSKRSVSIPS